MCLVLVQSDRNPVIPLRAALADMRQTGKDKGSRDSFPNRDPYVFKVNPGLLTGDVTSTHSLM
jgi:hypothetical protein